MKKDAQEQLQNAKDAAAEGIQAAANTRSNAYQDPDIVNKLVKQVQDIKPKIEVAAAWDIISKRATATYSLNIQKSQEFKCLNSWAD